MPQPPSTGIPRYNLASLDEIDKLKKLVKKVETENRSRATIAGAKATPPNPSPPLSSDITFGQPGQPLNKTYAQTQIALGKQVTAQQFQTGNLFEGGIANVEITREPIQCDNPVQWINWLMPELTPSQWQFEELMRMAGYLRTGHYKSKDKTELTDELPLLYNGWMANGSGKDLVLIAGFATWFPVIGARNRVVVTSASQDQIKFQTEVHIRDFCNRANKKFGQIFKSVQFHHVVPELGSEIKLYVTDEAGRAEGYHPFPGGKMALILNETKSIPEDIGDAIDRCTGYSHRIEISSPGGKHGFFYNNAVDETAVHYPAPTILGRYYHRKVTAYDCPWIPTSHIERMIYKKGVDSPWVKSSIFAEASDLDSPVVISEYEYNECLKAKVQPAGDDIGIGADLAAGGDEDAVWVRKGNQIIHKFFFRQQDTILAASLIDLQLMPWKAGKYTFRADNGGIGMGIIDSLTKLGWRVIRTNNQSPASNKREFLNLGAQQWFHVKRLFARKDVLPPDDPKTKHQLTTRYWRGLDSTQGKLALESKIEAKAAGRPSPDRADGYVLCFASYHPKMIIANSKPENPQNLISVHEFLRKLSRGEISPDSNARSTGRFTLMSKALY